MPVLLSLAIVAATVGAVAVTCRKKKTGPPVVPSVPPPTASSGDAKLPEYEKLTRWEMEDVDKIGDDEYTKDSIGDVVARRPYYRGKIREAKRNREKAREASRREKIAKGLIVEAPCDDKDKVFTGQCDFQAAEIFVPADVIEETDAKEPEGAATVGGASEVSKKDGAASKVSAKESAKSRKTEASTVNGNETTGGGNTTNIKSETASKAK